MKKIKPKKIILISLIIMGIFIRIYKFPNAILEMNSDEIMTVVNAKSILDTGKDTGGISYPIYLHAWGGQSIMLLYLMVLSIKIFGYTLFAARLPMLIVSIISLFVFYDFTKKITKNEIIALIGLGMLAISPWHILQSIWALDCNMFPHFLLIAMDVLYTGIMKKRKNLIYVSMICYAITLYCYGVAIYFVPLFLLIACIYLFKNKIINYKDIFICVAIFLILAIPIILMFAINALKIDIELKIFDVTIKYYPYLTRTKDMIFFVPNKIEQLFKNIISTIQMIFLQSDGAEWNSSKIFGTTYQISIIFVVIAVINIIKTMKKDKNEKFIIITWLGISLVTGIVVNGTNINRLNSIWYILLLLTAIGIYTVYEKAKRKKLYAITILIIYTTLFTAYNIYFYTNFTEVISNSGCFSKGFYQSLNYVKNLEKEKVYYDNVNDDGNIKLYVSFNNDENKNYTEIKDEEELKNRIENINDNEIVILNAMDREYKGDYNNYKIGNYLIIYK